MAELIRKQPCPVRIPPREITESEQLVEELLGTDTTVSLAPPAPQETTSRPAKLISLAVGALVLIGAVSAAAVITGEHGGSADPQPAASLAAITGANVLRPDLLSSQLSSIAKPPAPAAQPANPAPQAAAPSSARKDDVAAVPKPSAGQPQAVTSAPASTAVAQPRAGSTQLPQFGLDTSIGVVHEFYRRLREQPQLASLLVDPNLLGTDVSGFVQSWTSMRAVKVNRVEQQPNGTVLASVAMQEPGGGWLHTEQLLTLTKGEPLRIIGAELLSAQRS